MMKKTKKNDERMLLRPKIKRSLQTIVLGVSVSLPAIINNFSSTNIRLLFERIAQIVETIYIQLKGEKYYRNDHHGRPFLCNTPFQDKSDTRYTRDSIGCLISEPKMFLVRTAFVVRSVNATLYIGRTENTNRLNLRMNIRRASFVSI